MPGLIWEMGTAISCTECSQVGGLIQKLLENPQKHCLFVQLSFVQRSCVAIVITCLPSVFCVISPDIGSCSLHSITLFQQNLGAYSGKHKRGSASDPVLAAGIIRTKYRIILNSNMRHIHKVTGKCTHYTPSEK